MAHTRQIIGKTRVTKSVQSRGMLRRRKLIEAAKELIQEKLPQEISFKEIAERAGVPEGSAYHFYANKYDIFTAVASNLSALFVEAHAREIAPERIRLWTDLVDVFIERGAEVYRKNVIACELIIGSKTPNEIKLIDRQNDKYIASIMQKIFKKHFLIPKIANFNTILFYFIEVTDVLFGISYRDTQTITDEIIEEAKRLGKSYLSVYLPQVLERTKWLIDREASAFSH